MDSVTAAARDAAVGRGGRPVRWTLPTLDPGRVQPALSDVGSGENDEKTGLAEIEALQLVYLQ